jgi:hypothetical protein
LRSELAASYSINDAILLLQKIFPGIINNPECSIYSLFSGNSFEFLKVPECSFYGKFLGLITH